jgi:serine/threonine-protein kinase
VYFEMLTGMLPFARDTLNALMTAVISESAPDLRSLRHDIPLEMAECLNLLLDKSPANRPADAVAALQLLEAVLGHLRDFDSLLHEALDDEPGVAWRQVGEEYEVRVLLDEGRSQRVAIRASSGSLDGDVLLYSVCCAAQPDFYEQALRLNLEIVHGALAVQDLNGAPHFVVVNSFPVSTIDAEEIRRSVRDLAVHADSVEQRLTNTDRH